MVAAGCGSSKVSETVSVIVSVEPSAQAGSKGTHRASGSITVAWATTPPASFEPHPTSTGPGGSGAHLVPLRETGSPNQSDDSSLNHASRDPLWSSSTKRTPSGQARTYCASTDAPP